MRFRGGLAGGLAGLIGVFGVIACMQEGLKDRFSKGFDLLYENRYEDAENHFLVIAREMGRSREPEATLLQAKALYHVGRIDHLYLDQPRRAVGRLREALKLAPEAPFAFAARLEIGLIFQNRLMDYRTAALEFERLVSEFPDRKDIDHYQYRVAQSYFLLREFDQARTEARLLLQKWPKGEFTDEARLLIANAFYFEGRLQEAASAHKELLDSKPKTAIRAHSLFELGMCYQDLGDRIKAEKVFLDALKEHPRPDLVQMQLSQLRTRIVEEDEKAKPLDRPVPLRPRRKVTGPGSDWTRTPGLKPVRTRKTPRVAGPKKPDPKQPKPAKAASDIRPMGQKTPAGEPGVKKPEPEPTLPAPAEPTAQPASRPSPASKPRSDQVPTTPKPDPKPRLEQAPAAPKPTPKPQSPPTPDPSAQE